VITPLHARAWQRLVEIAPLTGSIGGARYGHEQGKPVAPHAYDVSLTATLHTIMFVFMEVVLYEQNWLVLS
jgi:hypothetical protein